MSKLPKKLREALLPGVEVKVYQGQDGTWHSSVLLDPQQYPDRDVLPRRGNRPLVDSGTHRWWYDESQGLHDYEPTTPRRLVHYTPAEARAMLDQKLAVLLTEIAAVNLAEGMAKVVKAAEHREHWDWRTRQDTRRVSHLRGGLPERRRVRNYFTGEVTTT